MDGLAVVGRRSHDMSFSADLLTSCPELAPTPLLPRPVRQRVGALARRREKPLSGKKRAQAREPEFVEQVQVASSLLRISTKRHHVQPCVAPRDVSEVKRMPTPIFCEALAGKQARCIKPINVQSSVDS